VKLFLIKILFLVLCIFIDTVYVLADDDFEYILEIDHKLMQLFFKHEECIALKEAIIVLDEEIIKKSENISLRKWRAPLSFAYSDFSTAKDDIEVIIRHIPDDIEAHMQHCIIKEVQSKGVDSIFPCYAEVVAMYREKIKKGIAQKGRDYVYALLMADMPEAQAEKEQYLAELGHSPFDEEERKLFTSFDRAKAIPRYLRCPGSPRLVDNTAPLTP
jgi:hypothetical protein